MKKTKNKYKLNLVEKLNVLAIAFPMLVLLFANNIIISVMSLIIQLVTIYVNIKKYKKRLNKTEKNLITLITIFFVITLIINAFGGYALQTTKTTIVIFSSIYLSLLLIISDAKKENTIENVTKVIVVLTIFLIAYAIIIKTFGGPVVFYQTDNGTLQYRQYLNILGIKLYQNVFGDKDLGIAVASLTGNPNMLAPIIVFSIIITLTEIEEKKNKNFKYGIDIVKIIFMLYGIHIVNSRTSIIILIIIIPMFFIIKPSKNKKYNKVKILAFLTMIFIIVIGIEILLPNFFKSIDLNGRDEMWGIVGTILDENLFNAFGLGASGLVIQKMLGYMTSMHNAYLSFIIDYGILMFMLFIMFNLNFIAKAIIYIMENRDEHELLFFKIFLIYISLLINGMTEGIFMTYSMFNYAFFYCIFYMCLIPKLKGEDSDNNIYTNI